MKRRHFVEAGLALAASWPLRGWSSISETPGDVVAKSLDGADMQLRGKDIADFAAGLRGPLLRPGDSEYDGRRRLWNAMFDGQPALIACCSGAADVQRTVEFTRENRLLTAVRAGGHSFSGKSTCNGGLVIDLQAMRGVRVDPAARLAYLEAGSLLGELDHETAAFGLATTAGTVSNTGAAGLTLGGGLGRLGRRFGLSCDNVASFDVVTADGRVLRASETANPDLYWGLRGGGGNFGVATNIVYRLHEMNPVIIGGDVVWPIEQAGDVFRMVRDRMANAPEEVHLEYALFPTPDGPVASVEACWSGDHDKGLAWLEPVRKFGKPLHDGVGPMPYVAIQSKIDALAPDGHYYYAKSAFLQRLDEPGMDLIIDVFKRANGLFFMFLDFTDGAYHRVPAGGSAFPNRDANYWLGLIANWETRDGADEKIARIRALWREIEPTTRGFYTNLADEDTTLARYRENYGGNLERLVALKAKYDPMNLFRLNANVPPTL
jgi:FAD/FMN-containing dehydrogenase